MGVYPRDQFDNLCDVDRPSAFAARVTDNIINATTNATGLIAEVDVANVTYYGMPGTETMVRRCRFTPGSPQDHPRFTPGSPQVHPRFTPGSPQVHPRLTPV